jgi:hypothetical protein
MRVISQDGTLDFPYELSTIRVYNEIISMGMCKDDSCRSIIARYSTEAKALKAIEMLILTPRFHHPVGTEKQHC